MAEKLKVYGWTGMRRELKTHHKQSREICAARSKAEVGRIVGTKNVKRDCFNICETGNAEELSIALAAPGKVFWRSLDARPGDGWNTTTVEWEDCFED